MLGQKANGLLEQSINVIKDTLNCKNKKVAHDTEKCIKQWLGIQDTLKLEWQRL